MQDILATFVPTTATTYLAHLKNFVKTAYLTVTLISAYLVVTASLVFYCRNFVKSIRLLKIRSIFTLNWIYEKKNFHTVHCIVHGVENAAI